MKNKSKSKSKRKTNQLPRKFVGGFIRDSVPQFSYYCGKNPLDQYLSPNYLNQCYGYCPHSNIDINKSFVGAGRQKYDRESNSNKKKRNNSNLYYKFF